MSTVDDGVSLLLSSGIWGSSVGEGLLALLRWRLRLLGGPTMPRSHREVESHSGIVLALWELPPVLGRRHGRGKPLKWCEMCSTVRI